MANITWRKVAGRVSCLINDEVILLDTECNKIWRLNKVGGRILELCEDTTASEMANVISQEFHIDMAKAIEDIQSYLPELEKAQLIMRA